MQKFNYKGYDAQSKVRYGTLEAQTYSDAEAPTLSHFKNFFGMAVAISNRRTLAINFLS